MNDLSDVSTADITAALLILERLGVAPQQLVNLTTSTTLIPTFDEYLDQVSEAVSRGTRRAYSTYWKLVRAAWGSRPINEPTALEIQQLAESAKANAIQRRNSREGRSAAEHLIASLRCMYKRAVADGLIRESNNPATKVAKPRRLPSTRRALSDTELADINHVAATTGNDPALDTLLLRLHTETACRRGGALALRRRDVDVDQCLVLLREKGETVRWQPISPTLVHILIAHYNERGSTHTDEQLVRYRNGRPITTRRYDHLWCRLGQHLPWVATQQISIHWLRHTTVTWVERHFGYGVARAFAGHNGKNDGGTTSTYIRADIREVATALAALTREDHPLAFDREVRGRANVSLTKECSSD